MKNNKANVGVVMNWRKLAKWIGVVFCAVVVGSVLLWRFGRQTSVPEIYRPSTARALSDRIPHGALAVAVAVEPYQQSAEDISAPKSSLWLRPGDRLIYHFSAAQRVELAGHNEGSADPGTPFQSMGVDLTQEGRLVVDVYSALPSKDHEGWLVGFRLANFAAERKIYSASDPMAEIENEMMQSSVLAEVLKTGKIRKMVPASLESAEAKTLWKGILSNWQVVLPEKSDTNIWEQTENDTTGTFIAKYTRNSPVYPQQLTKNKLRYVAMSTQEQNEGFNPKSSVWSEVAIVLNPYQVSIKGQETLDITGPGGATVKATSEFSYQLSSIAQDIHSVDDVAAQQELMDVAANVLSWKAESIDPAVSQPVKTPEEVAEIMERLERLLASGQGHGGEHVALASELIDAIKVGTTATVFMIMETLAENSPSDEYAATLVGILGAAGTPLAQDALLEIVASSDWPSQLRAKALQSMVQVIDPVVEADVVLMTLCNEDQEHANSAFLILAAMGERLRDSDPVRRENISRFVLEKALAADTADEAQMIIALGAIGNLGPAEVPSIVAKAFANNDAYIREQAIMSLQRIHTDEANMMIAASSTDSSESVRMAAVRMLSESNRSGGLDILYNMISNDSSESVRTAAVMGLSQWSREAGDAVVKILREASQKDPSEEVRKSAQSHLEFLQGELPPK